MGKNLELPHNSTIDIRYWGICLYLGGVFDCIGDLMGTWGALALGSWVCAVAFLDVMGWSSKLSLGRNVGPPQNDFNHFSKAPGKMRLFWGCFWLLWGTNTGQYRCAVWPPWMWIRWDGVTNWVWLKIWGCRNIILATFQKWYGNCVYFGISDARRGLPRCGWGWSGKLLLGKNLGPLQNDFSHFSKLLFWFGFW